jgi:hypothetical protein
MQTSIIIAEIRIEYVLNTNLEQYVSTSVMCQFN